MALQLKNSHARVMLDRMMECSEEHLSEISRHGEKHQRLIASRLLESTQSFKQWEDSHCQLLKSVVEADFADQQTREVKRMGLAMIHRKAPFEYLRDRSISGEARRRFFSVMYGRDDFESSIVSEHRNYLEASGSYLCVNRFSAESSMEQLADYEQRYTIYLRAQVRQLDNEHCGKTVQPITKLQQLRDSLSQKRRAILAAQPSRGELTLEELLKPTGDTVKMTYRTPM